MSWCKVDATLDSHPKIRKAGRDGREVFLFVLRRNALGDHEGRLPVSSVDLEYLADQLMADSESVRHGLSRAVTAGLLRVTETHVVISGWEHEWSKTSMTDAERQQRRRDKLKRESDLPTIRHEPSRTVTTVTEDQIRSDQIRVEEIGIPPLAPLARRRSPTSPLSTEWKPTLEHLELARERGVDLETQARAFRAHAEANDRRCVRWNAAFTQWLLKAYPDRKPTSGRVEPHAASDYPTGDITL
jgi:hypothetical protein